MARAALVVALIGLGDSLNPMTLGPAMYLATLEHARKRVAEFLAGFVAVNFVGGLIVMLGPGRLLLALVPRPSDEAKHVIELVAGIGLLVVAALVWFRRVALRRRQLPTGSGRRSGVKLGAGLAAVELPTALPYFAAIAVIVGTDGSIPAQIGLLAVFNVAFLAPVIALLVALVFWGDHARGPLRRANAWVNRHWPVLLAGFLGLIGIVVAILGLVGVIADH